MPETTVGLPDNNLFGNLIANTRPSANNAGSQTLNINSIQSDTKAEDVENTDDIPFLEILGQHIFDLSIHYTPNSPVPNTPAVESTNIELAQESAIKTNPSVLYEQILNTIQPADILQKAFTPYPESIMQDFGNNLFPNSDKTARSANLNIYTPFPGAHNEDTPTFPFVPSSQRESKWGFEEGFGNNISPNSDKTAGSAKLNIYTAFPGARNEDTPISPFVPPSQGESKWGSEERKGFDVLLDKHLIETHNPSSIFSLEKSNVNAVDEMDKPFIQGMDVANTLPKTDTLKLNPANNPEAPQVLRGSFTNDIQQLDLYSSDSHEINIKELPETYKLLAQNISPENKNNIRTPAINSSSKNTTEQHTESGLSNINGTVSSRQNISSISQSNEDWNPFDSNTQKQNSSDTSPFDAHIQKANNGSPFSLASQTTVSNAQSNVTDFQQNTQASPNSGTTLSSSIENAKSVNHIFHSNDTSNAEYAHENIMEQILQKIRITTHGDRSEIKLSLNPPELGNIKIHFMEENDEIKAKIYVENAEVKAAIENNAHHLKESVASHGIEIHKLEVYIQNDDANKEKSIENFNANNPHHHNQTHSQKGYDEDQVLNEEDITNNLQTETRANTSNLMVDYLI